MRTLLYLVLWLNWLGSSIVMFQQRPCAFSRQLVFLIIWLVSLGLIVTMATQALTNTL